MKPRAIEGESTAQRRYLLVEIGFEWSTGKRERRRRKAKDLVEDTSDEDVRRQRTKKAE